MELNPSQIGQITELKCQTYLIENGFNVLLPIGNYLKYDLVIEKNNKFYKIQCKHATELETGFRVRTRYDKRDNGKVIKEVYSQDDIDYNFLNTILPTKEDYEKVIVEDYGTVDSGRC